MPPAGDRARSPRTFPMPAHRLPPVRGRRTPGPHWRDGNSSPRAADEKNQAGSKSKHTAPARDRRRRKRPPAAPHSLSCQSCWKLSPASLLPPGQADQLFSPSLFPELLIPNRATDPIKALRHRRGRLSVALAGLPPSGPAYLTISATAYLCRLTCYTGWHIPLGIDLPVWTCPAEPVCREKTRS